MRSSSMTARGLFLWIPSYRHSILALWQVLHGFSPVHLLSHIRLTPLDPFDQLTASCSCSVPSIRSPSCATVRAHRHATQASPLAKVILGFFLDPLLSRPSLLSVDPLLECTPSISPSSSLVTSPSPSSSSESPSSISSGRLLLDCKLIFR